MRLDQETDLGTVLVVDDEALIRMNSADMLEDAGYRVIEADGADEALTILEGPLVIHLLFSDVDMPGSMDGVALAALVHERWPDIRLLLTSGHHQLRDADVPDAGRFVSKPYSCATMIDTIRALLPHG